ncbi:hypothetical protein ANANG_G00209000 [Anguilla anguilla]|uniref:Uncharacterized protein n=1 Tax=Anguilla anguilla TaxID=7936 RepID=A0A9D3RRT5_ANGAN|nr:hypothetical protein ANANG_G00209000 [Anguilla anguilla]
MVRIANHRTADRQKRAVNTEETAVWSSTGGTGPVMSYLRDNHNTTTHGTDTQAVLQRSYRENPAPDDNNVMRGWVGGGSEACHCSREECEVNYSSY